MCRRRTKGFSLIEVLISLGIIAIGIMGTMGVLVAVHQHNTNSEDSSRAYRACQEIIEQLLAMDYDTMVAQNGVGFAVVKFHPTDNIGTITITDISPGGNPDTLVEIQVRIQTPDGQYTAKPVDVQLISRRSRQ